MRMASASVMAQREADGWSGWLLATPTTLPPPEPFGSRSRATAMAVLPMCALHMWSEPSLVGPEPASKKCSRALASRCLAGCRSIQTTTASNYYTHLLALAPKARPLGPYFKKSTEVAADPLVWWGSDGAGRPSVAARAGGHCSGRGGASGALPPLAGCLRLSSAGQRLLVSGGTGWRWSRGRMWSRCGA